MADIDKNSTTLTGDTEDRTASGSGSLQDQPPKNQSVENTKTDDEYVHVFPTGFALWSVLAAVVVSYFLVFLDMAVMSTVTPAITSEFDSLVDIGWYGSAYQLGSSAFQPLSGKIYRYFSVKVGTYVARICLGLPGARLTTMPSGRS